MNVRLWVFVACVTFTLLAPLFVKIWLQDNQAMWMTVLAGAFATIATRFDDLVELSLGPLKAKYKETIDRAAATIEQLRAVALITSKALLESLMAGSFMGGMHLSRRMALHDDVMANLDAIGVSDQQKKQILAEWSKGIALIYARAVRNAAEDYFQQQSPRREDRDKYIREFDNLNDFDKWQAPTPQDCRKFFQDRRSLGPELERRIAEYEHFERTGAIRNRDEFVNW